MHAAKPFSHVAPLYDRLMHAVEYDLWFERYHALLLELCPHARSVLDLCCGTGAMTRRIMAAGFDVLGVDSSAQMLDVARSAPGPRPEYRLGDALDFELNTRFDGCFAVFDGLNYLLDVDQLSRTFMNIGHHLNPGGALLFDLNTAYAFSSGMFDEEAMDEDVPHWWSSDFDPKSLLVTVKMYFLVDDEPQHEIHVQRAHRPEEVITCLSSAGFEQIRCFDADSFGEARPDSDRQLWAARYRG